MTYAPGTLGAARSYLISRGVPANGVGIVGDVAHGTEGYHVGWDRLKLGYGTGDYSYGESSRDRVRSDAAMGLDLPSEGFSRWRELTLWLVAQCQAGTPDTQDIREIIYTPDGRTVKRWDRLGRRSSGDSSHLWHTHMSYFRDSESRDKTALFRRFFEGDDLNLTDEFYIPTWNDPEFKGPEKTSVQTSLAVSQRRSYQAWQASVGARNDIKAVRADLAALKAALATPTPTPTPAPVTVNVDAGQVASALAGNAEFVAAIVKAVNDDAAFRMKS